MRILLRRCRCRSISQLRLCGQTAAECECFFVHWPFFVYGGVQQQTIIKQNRR